LIDVGIQFFPHEGDKPFKIDQREQPIYASRVKKVRQTLSGKALASRCPGGAEALPICRHRVYNLIMPEFPYLLAQAAAPSASSIFYITILFIFLTAIITTIATKLSKDKCLKFLHGYHVTLERFRGQLTWGQLKVFSTGIEVVYDHPYTDWRGRKKTSYMIYQQELDSQLLSLLRYHDELTPTKQAERTRQIHHMFNPGPLRRIWRKIRNLLNTLKDAFNAAIGAVVGQYQRLNPSSAVLSTQGNQVTQIGQTLLSKFANAYEPLLEQYIGQQVILDIADPLNPNNTTNEFVGFLADYTQNFIAVFNVEHTTAEKFSLTLPDVEKGEMMAPLPPPPPPGAPANVLPAALKEENGLAVRIDAGRFRIWNNRSESVILRRMEREGFEPIEFGAVVPPNGVFDLPARDARRATLIFEVVRVVDVVAPRKFATVRHAGELVDRKSFVEEFHIDQLPLVPKIFRDDE
jgi:hypothetical protein